MSARIGTPGRLGSVIPGEVTETDTFVYRPWQHKFTDVLGNGVVQANVSPAEVSVRVDNSSSAVQTGKAKFYALDWQLRPAVRPGDLRHRPRPAVCRTLLSRATPTPGARPG